MADEQKKQQEQEADEHLLDEEQKAVEDLEETPTPMLEALLKRKPLWGVWDTIDGRIWNMKAARTKILKEYKAHLADPEACHINTGVLLGALNLIEGLLALWNEAAGRSR